MKTFQYFKLQVVAQLQGLENNLRHCRVLKERQQHLYTQEGTNIYQTGDNNRAPY